MEWQRFERLAADVEREADLLSKATPSTDSVRRLFHEEIHRSTVLAGSHLTPEEASALVERDLVAAGRTLAENVLVADYGEAARFVRAAPPPRRGRYLTLDEIPQLHLLAVRRGTGANPGRWRGSTARPFPSGMVPPPAWAIAREMAAFADRFAGGPPSGTSRIFWVADAHERLLRIHPFDSANGRVARLVTNLLLRRAGLPPFVVRRRGANAYVAALRRADSGDPWPLAVALGENVLENVALLRAGEGAEALAPLSGFASGAERAALYKAAQRGRLRAVRRGGALLTTRVWIDAYRSEAARRANS